MILPLRVFGSVSVKRMSSGLARAPISFATHLRSSSFNVRGFSSLLQSHEGRDRLTFHIVGTAHDRRLSHCIVRDQSAFHLHGAQAMSADVEDIIDTSHDPEISILIFSRAIPREIHTRNLRPVVLHVPVRIAVDRAQHAGPRALDDEETSGTIGHRFSVHVDDVGDHPRKRPRRGTRLCRDRARKRA